ncbi:MAG: hypothetical protein M0023_04955 [Desulfobacteraceae bacterium]|nr:hypothetical protein [Desulfobacteraceae bacterium]
MKRILCAALMTVILAAPAFAARLYLKDGGFIQAKRVWRSGGRVYVLATRDTMTSFDTSEVNLKRTFPRRHRSTKKIITVNPRAHTKTAAPKGAAEIQRPVDKKADSSLSPPKSPDSLEPSSNAGGVIRQQKKELAEKIAE